MQMMTLQEVQLKELDRKYKEYINNYLTCLYDYKFKIDDEELTLLNSYILSMNDTELRCVYFDNGTVYLNKKSIIFLVRKILAVREKIKCQYNLNKKYILNNIAGFKIVFHAD